jgi:hypothetical protein
LSKPRFSAVPSGLAGYANGLHPVLKLKALGYFQKVPPGLEFPAFLNVAALHKLKLPKP